MRVPIGSILLVVLATAAAEASPNCSVPRFRTLAGQTVDGYMSVKSGKRCAIIMRSSRGPTFGVRILARAAHGGVHVEGMHRVVYQSRAGFAGADTFTYSRYGLDTANRQVSRAVRVIVTVVP
jgi:hypothetical protein